MRIRIAVIVCLTSALTACQSRQPALIAPSEAPERTPLPPSLGRMQEAYPELASGRFVCLADFNSMTQASLFCTLDESGESAGEQPEVTVKRSIDKTGPGGLRAVLGQNQRLVFDGRRSATLALVRDWSRYELLLFSICGPPEGVALEFTVESGTDVPLRSTRHILARPGWRLFRIDLAELGDDIDLADVRSISWRTAGSEEPAELFFDDFLLTDNSRWLMGEHANEGELYVQSAGRRLVVGVRDRFELAFADGVIVEWRDDSGANMTVRTGLGPWPVPLPGDWYARKADPVAYDDPSLFAKWGPRAATRQGIVEQNDSRVVIEGQWRYLPDVGADEDVGALEEAPGHDWTYVIYPTGQVYVNVESNSAGEGWAGDVVGFATALSGRLGLKFIQPNAMRTEKKSTYVLAAQNGRDRSDMLYCPHLCSAAERQLEIATIDERRIVVTCGDVPVSDEMQTAHMLRFWPRDIESPVEADLFAADYQYPAQIEISRGQVVVDAPGDHNQDGFNESEGCYELALQKGVLRFRFNNDGLIRCPSLFRVRGVAAQQSWIYVDGRIVDRQGRDGAGNLLFRIPPTVGESTQIEVNARSIETSP